MTRAGAIGGALLVLGLAGALVVTLWPFAFDLSRRAVADKWASAEWELYYLDDDDGVILDLDLFLNVVMLAPMGVGWALLRRGRSVGRLALEAAALGVGTAALVEALQLLTPDRVTQLADLWRNGSGCVAGAALVAWLDRRGAWARRGAR